MIKEAEFRPDKQQKGCVELLENALERAKAGKGEWAAVVMSIDGLTYSNWSLCSDTFAVAGSLQFLAHRMYSEKVAEEE